MLIFSFIILFWVTIRIGLNAWVLTKHISFLTLSSAASLDSPSVLNPLIKLLLFEDPPLEYPVSSDWSAYSQLTQHR